MRTYKSALGMGLLLILLAGSSAWARPQRMSYSDTRDTIERIKHQSHRFEDNFDRHVSRDDMERAVKRFERTADHLEHVYSKDNAANASVRDLLNQAAVIDRFLAQNDVSPRVQSEWLLLRQDLDLLANSYGMNAEWPAALARAESAAPPVVVVVPPPVTADMPALFDNMQANTAGFYANVRSALAASPGGDVEGANVINQYIGDFMVSADRLKMNYSSGATEINAVNELLSRGEAIDQYMRNHALSAAAQQSWLRVRNDLIRLAAAYNLSPGWLSR